MKAKCGGVEMGGEKKLGGLGRKRNQHKKTQKNSGRKEQRTKTLNI